MSAKTKAQNDIISQLETPHGRLLLAPRFGKTKLAIDIILKFDCKKILWVVPEALQAKKGLPDEIQKWYPRLKDSVTITTHRGLAKVIGNHYDLIIFDEEQKLTKAMYTHIKKIKYGFMLTMTGTPSTSNDKLKLYKALELPILYQVSIDEAVDLGILSEYKILLHSIPLNEVPKTFVKSYLRVAQYLKSLIVGQAEVDGKVLKVGLKGASGLYLLSPTRKGYKEISHLITKRVRGYLGESLDGYSGKITVGSTSYSIMGNDILTPPDKNTLISRQYSLGSSFAKKIMLFEVLKQCQNQRNLVFCMNIQMAESLCNELGGVVYHSKSNSEGFNSFQEDVELKTSLFLVNAGGTGITYKNIDNVFVVQCNRDTNGTVSQKVCRGLVNDGSTPNIHFFRIEDTPDDIWVRESVKSFSVEPKVIKFDNKKFKAYD